ncbi:MAG: hypothetical protein H0X02_06650 [Nitrosomonas sp.]|nr:hypothetical protein [Nitrosomonas sp.]
MVNTIFSVLGKEFAAKIAIELLHADFELLGLKEIAALAAIGNFRPHAVKECFAIISLIR